MANLYTRWRRTWRWTLFVLALLGLSWAVHAWWPLSPRCTIRGPLVVGAVSPDGKTLTTNAMGAGPLQVWDTFSGRPLGAYLHKTWGLHNGCSYSPDRRFFAAFDQGEATGRDDPPGKLALVDLIAGREWQGIVDTDNALDIPLFSPKGNFLVVVGNHDIDNKKLHLVESRSGKVLATFLACGNGVRHMFTADERQFAFFATTSEGLHFCLWDTESRQIRRIEGVLDPRAGADGPSDCAMSPNGRTLFAPSNVVIGGAVRRTTVLWDLQTGQWRPLVPARRYVQEQRFSPDSRTLATWLDKEVELWDVPSGQRRALLTADPTPGDMAFSRDSRVLVVASETNESWTFWDVQTGQRLWQRTASFVRSRGFPDMSPDSRFLVEHRPSDGWIDILDTASGRTRLSIPLAEDLDFTKPVIPPLHSFRDPPHAFTPDDRFLAIRRSIPAREPGLIRKWLGNWWPLPASPLNTVVLVADLEGGREQFRLEAHDIWDLHIADDGRTLVTTHAEGSDEVICCWDVPSRPPLRWVVGIPLLVGTVVLLARWWHNRRTPKA